MRLQLLPSLPLDEGCLNSQPQQGELGEPHFCKDQGHLLDIVGRLL